MFKAKHSIWNVLHFPISSCTCVFDEKQAFLATLCFICHKLVKPIEADVGVSKVWIEKYPQRHLRHISYRVVSSSVTSIYSTQQKIKLKKQVRLSCDVEASPHQRKPWSQCPRLPKITSERAGKWTKQRNAFDFTFCIVSMVWPSRIKLV